MEKTLGHYKIVSELGRGGMGVVYKAYEESLNRYVAIKVLGHHLGHDDSFVKRFVREARAVAALSHPNVIQIFFIGHEPPPTGGDGAGSHYFVMEYVEGRSVHDLLTAEGAIEPRRAVRIMQQAASGLAAAHDRGLVHRDIKPANLLVTKDGRVKIADFGLALAPSDGATRLTATNALMGTPGYLSPEQCCGEPAGARSDIYSLGMTFYEMLTGSMPFKGESPLAVLRQILDEEPPPLLQVDPDLDPGIARVVERMAAKDPNARYASCHELVADLDAVLAGSGSVAAVQAGAPPIPMPRTAALSPTEVLPPVPDISPTVATARTLARVTGRPEDAATRAVPPAPPPPPMMPASSAAGAVAAASVAPTAALAAPSAAPPPVPPAGSLVTAPAQALVPAAPQAVVARSAASSGSRTWVIVAVMAVMLVVAVSAGGLFLGRKLLKNGIAGAGERLAKVTGIEKAEVAAGPVASGSNGQAGKRSTAGSGPRASGDGSLAASGMSRTKSDSSSAATGGASAGSSGASLPATASGLSASRPAADSPAGQSRTGSVVASAAGDAGRANGGGASTPRTSSAPAASTTGGAAPLSGLAAAPPVAPSGRTVDAPDPRADASRAAPERAVAQPPAPRRPALPQNPRVAVIGVGEPMFAGAAEAALESQLARHGIDLYDEGGILELRDSGGASAVAPSRLVALVGDRGVDVLILIEVEPLRDRDLNVPGRYASATTSRVRVDAFLAAEGDGIGRGWSEQVEYAELNAERQADAAMGRVSTAVAEAIASAWESYRAAAR